MWTFFVKTLTSYII